MYGARTGAAKRAQPELEEGPGAPRSAVRSCLEAAVRCVAGASREPRVGARAWTRSSVFSAASNVAVHAHHVARAPATSRWSRQHRARASREAAGTRPGDFVGKLLKLHALHTWTRAAKMLVLYLDLFMQRAGRWRTSRRLPPTLAAAGHRPANCPASEGRAASVRARSRAVSGREPRTSRQSCPWPLHATLRKALQAANTLGYSTPYNQERLYAGAVEDNPGLTISSGPLHWLES
ncbi:hypothetical protein C8Q78DRAFT_766479 [Trametes maxima]|nr:hypothetical protein C8Q78DRAFT_766479 [Trametes maxima]